MANVYNKYIHTYIFDEVKKSRKCISSSVTSIDNVTEDIPSHFAKLYENLYNSVDDDEDLRKLEQKISSNTGCPKKNYLVTKMSVE